jgi:thiosulfate reductase cytochrome b subunit
MASKTAAPAVSHPLWLLISHWLNAVAVIIMILSGWRIYDASPVFPFIFPPQYTLGGWLAGALKWHFAAMWLLFGNGIFYIAMALITGRFRTKFLPVTWKGFKKDLGDAARLKLVHDDLDHYNTIQKLLYLGVIVALVMMVVSGLVMWKPVQFPTLRTLLGGYDNARVVHFVFMSAIAGFILLHVFMAALVPRTIKGMLLGRY